MSGFHVMTLAGVPVRISIWYVLMVAYMGYLSQSLKYGLLWAVTLTVSILVHEFGHAMMAKRFSLHPQVLLHGWGGLCAHERSPSDKHDALIIAAGPGAGLVLGGLVWLVGLVLLGLPAVPWGYGPDMLMLAEQGLTEGQRAAVTQALGADMAALIDSGPAAVAGGIALTMMIYINIFWSLVNLLPLWPLDGGQLFRLGLIQKLRPVQAEKIAHRVGAGIAIAAAVWCYLNGMLFVMILAGLLAWENISQLMTGRASGPIRPKNRFASKLLEDGWAALAAGDYREAARLAHQVRSESTLTPKTIEGAMVLLTKAYYLDGDPEEALSWAQHAPDRPEVAEVQVRAFVELGRVAEARDIIRMSRGFGGLPADNQKVLRDLVDGA